MADNNGGVAQQLQEIFSDDNAKIPPSVSNRLILAALIEERKERKADIGAILKYHQRQEAIIAQVPKNTSRIEKNTKAIDTAKKVLYGIIGALSLEVLALFIYLLKEFVLPSLANIN